MLTFLARSRVVSLVPAEQRDFLTVEEEEIMDN
jgi:hypothetical protein